MAIIFFIILASLVSLNEMHINAFRALDKRVACIKRLLLAVNCTIQLSPPVRKTTKVHSPSKVQTEK